MKNKLKHIIIFNKYKQELIELKINFLKGHN